MFTLIDLNLFELFDDLKYIYLEGMGASFCSGFVSEVKCRYE